MIRLDHVSKVYPRTGRPALDDVSIDIERGELAFVVGASGSGKSTMLRLVIAEETATSGRVLVAGKELDTLPRRRIPALRRDIGVVFQDFRLLPRKTVYANVAFALEVIGTKNREIKRRVPHTLEMVGLGGLEQRFPHQLSGGEQQRVAIARAIVNRPSILLADEPTGNLDPGISLEIMALLDQINARGTTVLVATHDDEIVNTMRRRVLELDAGRLVRDEQHGSYRPERSADLVAELEPDTTHDDTNHDDVDTERVPALVSASSTRVEP